MADVVYTPGELTGVIYSIGNLTGSLSNATLRGMSAYECAVESGFVGSMEEWLESLKGDKVALRNNNGMVQWKYTEEDDTEWRDLIDIGHLDYNSLTNKPTVNGQALTGSMDLSDMFVSKEDFALITDEDIEDILDRLKGGE